MGYAVQSTGVWRDWSASSGPSGFTSVSIQISEYKDDGNTYDIFFYIVGVSSSNLFTIPLPFAISSTYTAAGFMHLPHVTNNSINVVGRCYASGSGSTLTVEVLAGTAWSGTKGIRGTIRLKKA